MASLSNINGLFDVHSTGAILFSTSHGTSGQILRSNGNAAPTWVDASTVIGGPYLPLTGGTLSGPLSGTSATFSGKATFSDKIQIGSFISNDYAFTLKAASVATLPLAVFEDTASANGNGIVVNSVNTPNNYIADFKIGNVSKVKINKDGGIDVAGNQITIDPASGDAILQLQSSTQTLRIDQNSIRTGTNNNLALFTNGNSNQLVLKQSNGFVGIGTASPNKRLTIGGVNATEGVNLYTKVGSTLYKLWEAEQYFSDEGYQGMYYQNVKKIQFRTNGDSYINGGNVGIGTASPSEKLHVVTTALFGPNGSTSRSTDGVGINFTNNNTFSANADITDANRYLAITNDSTTANTYAPLSFRINPGGGSSNAMADIKLVSNGSTHHLTTTIRNPATGNFIDTISIAQDGNVGIGTTTPYSRLDVNGVIANRDANEDPNFTVAVVGMSTINGGSLQFTQGFAGTSSAGDTVVFRYNATGWKSWSLDYTFAGANMGLVKGTIGGYNNGSGGGTNAFLSNSINATVSVTNSGQNVIVTFTGNFGIHMMCDMRYSQGGGDGAPRADRASLTYNS